MSVRVVLGLKDSKSELTMFNRVQTPFVLDRHRPSDLFSCARMRKAEKVYQQEVDKVMRA
jgi:hypothetical protein